MGRRMKEPERKAVKTSISLEADLYKRVKMRCELTATPFSTILSRALELYLKGSASADRRVLADLEKIKSAVDSLTRRLS